MTKNKMLIFIAIILCLFLLFSCSDSDATLHEVSSSFKYAHNMSSPVFYIDYKSSVNELNIDNFSIDVYVGWIFNQKLNESYTDLSIDILARNSNNKDNPVVIKEIEDFSNIIIYVITKREVVIC